MTLIIYMCTLIYRATIELQVLAAVSSTYCEGGPWRYAAGDLIPALRDQMMLSRRGTLPLCYESVSPKPYNMVCEMQTLNPKILSPQP